MFFLHILILYHLLEEVIFTLYYLYTTTISVYKFLNQVLQLVIAAHLWYRVNRYQLHDYKTPFAYGYLHKRSCAFCEMGTKEREATFRVDIEYKLRFCVYAFSLFTFIPFR